jgi:TolB-like protein
MRPWCTESLTTDLSLIAGAFVIARNTTGLFVVGERRITLR